MHLLLKKVKVLCSDSKYHLKKKDIYIKNGIIEKIGDQIQVKGAITIEQKELYVSAGWVELFSDFCDPGAEQKEDLQSGSEAAAAGGYTDVCLVPSNHPPTTNKASVDYLKSKSELVQLHPIGAVSKQLEGKDLAEMYDMKAAGAIAFSDGVYPIQSAGLMAKALQYIKSFHGVILQIPDDKSISQFGYMHEGTVSTKLGLQGIPSIAETIFLKRDIDILQYTKSALHITGISTKESVALIRQAKKQGLHISCSVTPAHLLYNDTILETYDSCYKIHPPLRTEADRLALIKGVEDGTIDCIAAHHFPQDWDSKETEFAYAKNGMIQLQTTLPALLQVSTKISIDRWVEMLTLHPRQILGLPSIRIEEKEKACLTVFDTNTKWELNDATNKSKSKNSPFYHQTLQGKIIAVVNNHRYAIHE